MERQWSGTDSVEFYILSQTLIEKEAKTIKMALRKPTLSESQEISFTQ